MITIKEILILHQLVIKQGQTHQKKMPLIFRFLQKINLYNLH
jgi:hypothetical protein